MYDATWLFRLYARRRSRRLAMLDTQGTQLGILSSLIRCASGTRFGRDHEFLDNWTLDDFRTRVPLRSYDEFWNDYWRQDFPNLAGCTWPGPIPYLAVSSGTSTGTTKYLPISHEMRKSNTRAAADVLTHHLVNRPESRVLAGRIFMLGGSTGLVQEAQGVSSGDLSGIAAAAMPGLARLRYFPPRELEWISDWQDKIRCFAEHSLETTISAMAGTPSWLLIYLEKLAEIAGQDTNSGSPDLSLLYPELELLVHGGVSWEPYRDRFKAMLEGSRAETREVYPASEGFFAVADRGDGEGLRLIIDNGIFYEFIPLDQIDNSQPDARWSGDVETGRSYALAVTTCAGLWRYLVGDTVIVVDNNPLRVIVTGRTSYMLSAFGEHVIGLEVEVAVSAAARSAGMTVNDFAVGSVFPDATSSRGGHMYIVEFATGSCIDGHRVDWLQGFADTIDRELCALNDDYSAHRAGGYGMASPRVRVMPPGGFAAWMKNRGKLGGQNKVPRIINDRDLFTSLCKATDTHSGMK